MSLFFLAAVLEISGGYLVWKWFREKRGVILGIIGAAVLFVYGMTLTLQPAHFGRVYAAYGGVFIVSSLIWGALLEKTKPDKQDVIGATVALAGVIIIMYMPR